MSHELSVYLNDHLAGSVAAAALIDDLLASEIDLSLKSVLTRTQREIGEEQQVLRKLLAAEDAQEGTAKKGMAWLAEKLSRLKLGGKNADGSCLPVVQALEVLYLGITGKLLGWHVLDAVFEAKLLKLGIDTELLRSRAIAQRDAIEQHRLRYAKVTFGSRTVTSQA